MKKLLMVLALGLAPLVANAQTPVPSPSPSPSGWTATLYAGASTIATQDEKREYMTARLSLAGPLGGGFSAVARLDATGEQDGGAIDADRPFSLLRTFRAMEANGGLSYRASRNLDIVAVGGATFSIEGATGAPVDPRLFTGAGLLRVPLYGGHGFVAAGGGWYGPVGGYAALFSASIPVGSAGFTVIDYALPIQAATGRRTWLLKVGATVRVKSFDLGKVVGR